MTMANDIEKRAAVLARETLKRREESIKDDVRSLPPREQLRLAADFVERGQVAWGINVARLALARLEAGEEP